jgi:tetratricopeptide (TPR) repeat protein
MHTLAPTVHADRIGNYQVLERLGAGGVGVVYKALDLKLNRTVALKFLAEEGFDPPDRERLLREARAASALDHANIGTVYGVEDADDGRLFIVMAFYDGETLAQKIRHGPLSRERSINIACQVARGLQHAHLHGVVHRDIKPSNVILTSDGVAKIVDFGLARHFTPLASTQSGGLSGTLLYMSPEQAMAKSVDARSDIWSLGVMLYQMLTGRLPFSGENAADTLLAILHSPPAPLDDLPEELQLILYRALAKDPLARYQNCADLLRETEKFAPNDRERTVSISPRELHHRVRVAARALVPHSPGWRALSTAGLLLAIVIVGLVGLRFSGRWPFRQAHAGSSGAVENSPAYESYMKGRQYLQRYDRSENIDRAIAQFENAVKAEPDFALGFSALGEAYWYRYRMSLDPQWLPPALKNSKHALELNDRLPTVHVTLGRLHGVRNEKELALQEFEKALKLERHNPDALLGLAGVYASMDRPETEETYRNAIALRPEDWSGYYELGNFYFGRRDFQRAAEEWRRVITLTPDNPRAHSSLGVALQELGMLGESEAELKKSLEVQPTYAGYAMLGRLYYQERRWAEAAELGEKAAKFTRTDYRVWAALGLAYEWLKQPQKAELAYREELACLEGAARIKSDDPTIQSELGLLYSKQRRGDLAIPRIQAALARAPDDPRVWSNAGETYENLGDRKQALGFIKKAIEKGWTLDQLQRNPGLRNLLTDPRFRSTKVQKPAEPQQ